MEYFMFYGSLLGCVREGSLLEMDDDIDILINARHRKEVYKIIEEDFDIIDTTQHPNHSPHFLQGTRMIGDKRTYIDFYLFDSEINKTNIIDRWNFWGRWEEPDYHLMIPKSLIYPIKKKTFEFGTCGIPAQEVETVKYLYGERWMHPSDKGKQYTTIMKNGRPYVVYL
tara:strand:- start:76 stop:582 length:507 start_codon:yes stop_codon:yes gene_type:complete